ncbi:manganese-dependent inorganic pyrophosphatase [Treponema primitia ZAS-2]|uniref:inorganic diphosphatase n=1 Tax=Treponema primitia (strain ATCC BAA-887 / DSM 12427 / ZAS-2) TaxID=545694 RepID=F5YKG9_TREPZ|nr:putative manganese-dependent inorganic diphosphatase [Treponema primitia]AEF84475.1 manganese-dependent inorganic pyrophosphatase [Treponema primitia ZAS-2]
MKKKTYIIGHRNPDTDSVVSAAAYARLKQAQGQENVFPARAGNIGYQTEYIFNRFKVPVPEYLPDLIPKASYYISEPPVTIAEDVTVWEALERMQKDGLRVIPIVDSQGIYKSMLHYRGFANYIITHINPHKKSYFPVSIDHLTATLRAQPITVFNSSEVKKSPIVVAGSYNDYFKKHLEEESPDDSLVILGDRWDLQKFCLERKVRALILSNGHTLDKELVALATKNHVSVITSPFDTSSTAMLIIYSAPVSAMGDDSVPLVHLNDPVRKIREPLSTAPSRCLPVGDDEGRVAGIIFEGDLIKEPNIEVIMVDHNEPNQAIEGIENYRILEVIDHHRLGNLSTKYPITFINKVVGATCTIIANLYRESHVPMDKEIASILLCGILSDTLSLHSATTTDTDRNTAEYLSSVTGLDIIQLGQELQTEANRINARPAEELVAMDMKEYAEQGVEFSVSQVETDRPDDLVTRKDEILGQLEKICSRKKWLFSALLVTDVTTLDSLLFVAGKKSFLAQINFPRKEDGIYVMKDVVSRKKQLIPLLSELVEKAKD